MIWPTTRFARRRQVTGLLAEFHDRLRDRVRDKEGGPPDPTAAIVDSQSLRAAADVPRSTSGWDGGKKVGGRRQRLVVDCLGMVLAVEVTAASVQDRDPGLYPWPFASVGGGTPHAGAHLLEGQRSLGADGLNGARDVMDLKERSTKRTPTTAPSRRLLHVC
ncbi:hypothetical protein DT019_37290 [Streptomyces sp. SDr-06]|uniref:transposase n=1 Tax=Streptomyces sp. SDr-06 TaxID=2267702 RepID=UPI000DEB1A72|nr:hypothetical protein DT019_37290 [Streptomyces sp. SDr-06]